MADTKTEKTVASELREAAERLRGTDHHGGITGDCDNPELLSLIVALLEAREPLASWLESAAWVAREHPQDPDYAGLPDTKFCTTCNDEETTCVAFVDQALAVAQVLNGTAQ